MRCLRHGLAEEPLGLRRHHCVEKVVHEAGPFAQRMQILFFSASALGGDRKPFQPVQDVREFFRRFFDQKFSELFKKNLAYLGFFLKFHG